MFVVGESIGTSGAFELDRPSGNPYVITFSSGGNGYYPNTFSASRSNSVYTDNGKIYPASVALNFIIKA